MYPNDQSRPPAPYQPPPQFYLYPQPVGPQNGMATAGLVLGIVATVFSLIPFGVFFIWPASILAIIFGAIGHNRANNGLSDKKQMAIWGWVLGIVSLVLAPLFWLVLFSAAVSTTAP